MLRTAYRGATAIIAVCLLGSICCSQTSQPPRTQEHREIPVEPREFWAVDALLYPNDRGEGFLLRIWRHPSMPFTWTLPKRNIVPEVRDSHGKLVSSPRLLLPDNLPEVIQPIKGTGGFLGDTNEYVVTLDRTGAKPDMYTFAFHIRVDAADVKTGKAIELKEAVARWQGFIPPQPDRQPALEPGQVFINVPSSGYEPSHPMDYSDTATGKPVTWKDMAATRATLETVKPVGTKRELTFKLEGYPHSISITTDKDVMSLPDLIPVVTDDTIRYLKSRYEGKKVWCYGGSPGSCVPFESNTWTSGSTGPDVPMTVLRIERIAVPQLKLTIGAILGVIGDLDRSTDYTAVNPILVVLQAPPKSVKFSGGMGVGNGSKPPEVRTKCEDLMYNIVSDRWDFERDYNNVDPFKSHPKWPAKMRARIKSGEPTKGMTREMLAWTINWPCVYGTREEILRQSVWEYNQLPPHTTDFYFKNDRLVRIDEPTMP